MATWVVWRPGWWWSNNTRCIVQNRCRFPPTLTLERPRLDGGGGLAIAYWSLHECGRKWWLTALAVIRSNTLRGRMTGKVGLGNSQLARDAENADSCVLSDERDRVAIDPTLAADTSWAEEWSRKAAVDSYTTQHCCTYDSDDDYFSMHGFLHAMTAFLHMP